jgi:hypothetical protein
MTILSKEVLCTHGPYIDFVDYPTVLNIYKDGWPTRSTFEEDIFFQLADSLVETYCDVTQTWAIFDPYTSIQLHRPDEIQTLAGRFISWAEHITYMRGFDLDNSLRSYNLYEGAQLQRSAADIRGEDLRLNLIETALFIATRLAQIAHANRVLLIDSI